MSRRTIAIAAALSVLALGSPLIIANANPVANHYFFQGTIKYNQGNYQEAIVDFNRAVELNPLDAQIFYNRGLAKYFLEDNLGAADDFTKAIELDPLDADSYDMRGNAKSLAGDEKGALSDYNKAVELNPQQIDFYVNRALTKINLEDYQGAITDLTKALEILSAEPSDFTVHSDAYYIRGNAREKLNNLDGACSDWRKAAEWDPEYKEPAELVRLRC